MKNHIVILLVLLLTFSACEDDFLQQDNPNALTTHTFWKSEADFEKGLNSAYGALQFASIFGRQSSMALTRSDVVSTTTIWGNDWTTFNQLTYNNNTSVIPQLWSDCYVGIFRCNQVIGNLVNVNDANFTQEEKYVVEAQARFLRAFFYSELAFNYNQAIIHVGLIENIGDFQKEAVAKEVIVSDVIIPDLEYAATYLPASWTDNSDIGRATTGAVKSLLGKTYLFAEEWTKAATSFKEVIESGTYALVDDPAENFVYAGEFNSESIFEINYSDNLKPNTDAGIVDDYPDGRTGSEASSIAGIFLAYEAGGYNLCLPTYWLEEMFVDADQKDPSDDRGTVYSPRCYGSLLTEHGDGPYMGSDDVTKYGAFRFGWAAKIKKFVPWDTAEGPLGPYGSRQGVNYKAIRLADVFLMYAEAVLQRDGETGVAEAIKYIDYVRDRAGVIKLSEYQTKNGGQIPQLHVSRFNNQLTDFPLVAVNAASIMEHIQMVERPLELCFEGHRWKDLTRWGITNQVFTIRAADEVKMVELLCSGDIPGKTIDEDKDGNVYPWFIESNVRAQFEGPNANYISEIHDYFPLPDVEIQSNGKVSK